MPYPSELLIKVLQQPSSLASLSLAQWDQLLPWARSTNLMGRLAHHALSDNISSRLPVEPRWHLNAAAAACEANQTAIRWQTRCIEHTLPGCDIPVILLKGAAYLQAGLPPAAGRFCGDVDLLVEKARLAQVEAALVQGGWKIAPIGRLHERYFRATLHELPPMVHPGHPRELDIHHNILPSTDHLSVDAAKLFAAAKPLSQRSVYRILSPPDMVLHAAAHLFRSGRFHHGLRDLFDLHDLVDHFSNQEGFWDRLTDRAAELNLRIPCFWGMRYLEQILATSIPAHVQDVVRGWKPSLPPVGWMDRIVKRAALPSQFGYDDRRRSLAHLLLGYYPIPRLSVMATPLFWLKRIPLPFYRQGRR